MKHLSLLFLILIVIGISFVAGIHETLAQVEPPPVAPSWWGNTHLGNYAFAKWSEPPGPPYPATPPNDATHWLSDFLNTTDFKINAESTDVGLNVTVTLGNIRSFDHSKFVCIYVRGNADWEGSYPTNINILGRLDNQNNSDWNPHECISGSMGGGIWAVKITGGFSPQPEEVIITFCVIRTALPSDPYYAAPKILEAWAGEICVGPYRKIPTLTEWGLVVLAVLLLTAAIWILWRRRRTATV